MPPVLNYPGVYIQELPSAVHTITGVATSIAAFVGWAPQGPTDQAALVLSFPDFQNQFGGLDSRSYLGYAVNQFFANGGQQAYIVRLVSTTSATAKATVGGTLPLFASSPGLWGSNLEITVTLSTADLTRFSLEVRQISTQTVLETFYNLSATSTDPHYVVTVIDNDSPYVTFVDPATGNPPASISGTPSAATKTPLIGGLDGPISRR